MSLKPHALVVGFFRLLARCAIRHPKQVLFVAALVTLAAAPGILRLKLRTDGHALVSPTAPEVQARKVSCRTVAIFLTSSIEVDTPATT